MCAHTLRRIFQPYEFFTELLCPALAYIEKSNCFFYSCVLGRLYQALNTDTAYPKNEIFSWYYQIRSIPKNTVSSKKKESNSWSHENFKTDNF